MRIFQNQPFLFEAEKVIVKAQSLEQILMKIELENNSHVKCNEEGIQSVAEFALNKLGIHPDSELAIRLVTEEEILASIRQKGIVNVEDVLAVVIEANGDLSVIKKTDNSSLNSTLHGIEREDKEKF